MNPIRLPENVSQLEFEAQLRNLNSTLGPVGHNEGDQERRNSQAVSLVLQVKHNLVRVELINGVALVLGKR